MMSKKTYLIVDGNNQCYRAFYKYPDLRSEDGTPTSLLYGLPMILKPIIDANKPKKVYVVFDGGKHRGRLELMKDYKKRESKGDFDYESFFSQKEKLKDLLPLLGVNVVWKRHYEADDFIYALTKKFKRRRKVIIVSSDKDFHQLIGENVWQYNAHKQMMLKDYSLKEHYGYRPHQCVDYLSLIGDTSDNIPGVGGVGKATAQALLEKYDSLQSFKESGESYPRMNDDKLAKAMGDNRMMIDLKLYWDCYISEELDKLPITKGNFDSREFYMKARELSMTGTSINKMVDTYKTLS